MPKTNINYNNSVIYKIQHHEKLDLIYVGSTTDFTRRKAAHKNTCNNSHGKNYNVKLYKMIRYNGGWIAFKMVIIKVYPCLSKTELLIEEDRMMMELKTSLNSIKSHCSEDEIKRRREEKIKCQNIYYENIKAKQPPIKDNIFQLLLDQMY